MIPRAIANKVLELTTKFPIVAITGPRQSGKTTLSKMVKPNYAYVNRFSGMASSVQIHTYFSV